MEYQANRYINNGSAPGFYGVIAGYQGPNTYRVCVDQQELTCKLAPKAIHQVNQQLIVGDQVILSNLGEIQACLPRTTNLVRLRGDHTRHTPHPQKSHIIAANIDVAVIVATAAEPAFSPSVVDRYLLICQYGSIQPLVCLNKCDLTDIRHPILNVYRDTLGIEVIETSVKNNTGMAELKSKIVGKSVVLVGASGVGKSSIINQLLGKTIKTQTISSKTKKGRHTTTNSSLYPLEKGHIIDTPGVRSLDIGNIPRSELKNYFPEFIHLEQCCRYRDCIHLHEKNCAVKDAQADPVIRMRYLTYLRILDSLPLSARSSTSKVYKRIG